MLSLDLIIELIKNILIKSVQLKYYKSGLLSIYSLNLIRATNGYLTHIHNPIKPNDNNPINISNTNIPGLVISPLKSLVDD